MGKFLKKFTSHSDYNTYISGGAIRPNVSYCVDNNDVHYNPFRTKIIAKFNIGDTTSATKIMYQTATSQFSEIEIDGVVQQSVVSTYTFNTTGEHTVTYTLQNETSIGASAFSGCTNITNVTIPDNVTSIGSHAFYNCGFTNIEIPNTVNSIGEDSFSHNGNLTSVNVYAKNISNWAFRECANLTSVIIGNTVTSIGRNIFQNCSGLTSITVDNGNTIYDSRNNCNAIIKTSDNRLVAGCKNTVIPNTIIAIGDNVFYGCTGLTSITIPSSVTSIGSYVFYGCTGLTNITVDSNNTTFDSRDNCNAVIQTSNNSLVAGCQNTVIPNSVTSIGSTAFNGCTGLTSITIPSSVTSIGEDAFGSCGLTSIEIPSTVRTIGSGAFSGCGSLVSVYCYPTTPPTLGSYAFYRNNASRKIYVPSSRVNTYKTATNWKTYASYIYAIPT